MQILKLSRIRQVLVTSLGALALGVIGLAAAADEQQQVATALTHAKIATQQKQLDGVQMHLKHAINCLVGGQGDKAFPDAMNPCKGMGQGAIADASTDAERQTLQTALDSAEAGVNSTSFDQAHSDAMMVVKTLEQPGS